MESSLNIYQVFSQIILSDSPDITAFKDLSSEKPSLRPLLPSMIKNLCHFMLDPNFSLDQEEGSYFFIHFDHSLSAQLSEPKLEVRPMLPFEVCAFINSQEVKAIFDAKELGATIVSKSPLPLKKLNGVTALTLEPFFRYAFSNDLWSPEGKWPRFHTRLITLLSNKSILVNSLGPGHYLLKGSAKKLEGFGIQGKQSEDTYQLILPWSYPLKALIELEKIISQEF